MTLINDYREGEGASHALTATLARELESALAAPQFEGDDWAILRTGQIVDARSMGDRPHRRLGRHTTYEPESFADLVARYATRDTTIWADRDEGNLIAIFNDHPATDVGGADGDTVPPPDSQVTTEAGFGDHSAILQLNLHSDWTSWQRWDGQLRAQREFAEHIEDMAHTMIEPSGATMLEVASSLTTRSVVDGSSKVRLDNGDVEFRFVQETEMKAGRGAATVAIPSEFTFGVPVWDGTVPMEFTARLRVRPLQHDGVQMGYRLIKRTDIVREAFDTVVADIQTAIPGFVPIYRGRATR